MFKKEKLRFSHFNFMQLFSGRNNIFKGAKKKKSAHKNIKKLHSKVSNYKLVWAVFSNVNQPKS